MHAHMLQFVRLECSLFLMIEKISFHFRKMKIKFWSTEESEIRNNIFEESPINVYASVQGERYAIHHSNNLLPKIT